MVAALLFTIASVSLFWLDRVVDVLMPASWRGANISRRLRSAAGAMGRLPASSATLLRVLMLSFAVQLLRIAQAYVLGLGLGIAVPVPVHLVFIADQGCCCCCCPVSISEFGLPQGAIVWLLRPMHVPDPQSFALSTLIVLSGLAGNLPERGCISAEVTPSRGNSCSLLVTDRPRRHAARPFDDDDRAGAEVQGLVRRQSRR